MIVIATNNGKTQLPHLLESLVQYGTSGHSVLVCDTGSSDESFCKYLTELPSHFPSLQLEVTKTPYQGYDTGAYLWAAKNYESEDFFFMQDSLRARHPNWLSYFLKNINSKQVCPWIVFRYPPYGSIYRHQEEEDFVKHHLGTAQTSIGIFGPIFAAKRESILALEPFGIFNAIPSKKLEQEAMERGWAVAFQRAKISVNSIYTYQENLIQTDSYGLLKKVFLTRA